MNHVEKEIAKLDGVFVVDNQVAESDSGFSPIEMSLGNDRTNLLIEGYVKDTDTNFKVICVSKKNRQAVIELDEQQRNFRMNCWSTDKNIIENKFATAAELISLVAKRNCINITVKSVESIQFYLNGVPRTNDDNNITQKMLNTNGATLTVNLKKSKNYFLVGYDESKMFISQLHKKPKSVVDAHVILTPQQVKGKKWLRQGEFFLLPISKETKKKLFSKHFEHPFEYRDSLHKYDHGTDHLASVCIAVEGRQFVNGFVGNERHKKIFLDDWHEVFVNNEIENDEELGYD